MRGDRRAARRVDVRGVAARARHRGDGRRRRRSPRQRTAGRHGDAVQRDGAAVRLRRRDVARRESRRTAAQGEPMN